MKLLLDESVPRALGFAPTPYYVRTAQTAGFAGLLNGQLMSSMKAKGYDVLITFDQNLPYQQNANLPVAVIVLKANDNRVVTALNFAPQILALLDSVDAGLPHQIVVLELRD
jgi:hypothetical protein